MIEWYTRDGGTVGFRVIAEQRSPAMTTNKPTIVAWGYFYEGMMQDFGYSQEATEAMAGGGAESGYLAEVLDCGSGDVAANARLIAAAPELLETLEMMMGIIDDSRGVDGYHLNGAVAEWDEFEEVELVRRVIAKVRGGA